MAPSHGGFDAVPVLRHCLRARSLLVSREVVLSGLMVAGFVLLPTGTIWALAFVLPFALLTTRLLRGLSGIPRFLTWMGLWLACILVSGLIIMLATLFSHVSDPVALPTLDPLTGQVDVGTDSASSALGMGFDYAQMQFFLALLVALGVVVGYRVVVYQVLADALRPGASAPSRRETNGETEDRLQWIGAAQAGNLTLYSGTNPFLGAGDLVRSWTIAVELDRRANAPDRTMAHRQAVEIDPLELHAFVRTRLGQMSAQAHPTGIINLSIKDQVVASGRFNQLYGPDGGGPGFHPLVDQECRRPWTSLSPSVIYALIRNPQAGARHYQRVDINSEGPAVTDEFGHPVILAEDRGNSVTAFIHLAVEGRMLYTEFVVTVQPTVARAYRRIDELPVHSPLVLAISAIRDLRLQLFRDIVAAPARLARMVCQGIRDRLRMDDPATYAVYDYGARISLREQGVGARDGDFIKDLDTYKYTKLVEERLTSAVLDFLEGRRVDTTAYRRQATAVSMSNTTHYTYSGTFRNAQFGGAGAEFRQQNSTEDDSGQG